MRKIIFRGERKPLGLSMDFESTFVFGDLIIDSSPNQKPYIRHEGKVYEVYKDTVGQFSGLYDRKQREIYEGDILKWAKNKRLYVVKFMNGMFYASVEECNEEIYGGFPLHVLASHKEKGYECEIVGNIHENKELLKKENNEEDNV